MLAGTGAEMVATDVSARGTELVAAAPGMAAMIAGTRAEWRRDLLDGPGEWVEGKWAGSPGAALPPSKFGAYDDRLVRPLRHYPGGSMTARMWCVEMLLSGEWEQVDDDDGIVWHTLDGAYRHLHCLILAGCVSRMRISHQAAPITIDDNVRGGEPCITDTRVPVASITRLFPEPDEWIHDCYPAVPLDDIRWPRHHLEERATT